jgi:ribose-phosphate pyrophosphokinase
MHLLNKEFKIYGTSGSADLAATVASISGVSASMLHSEKFSDGEVYVKFTEPVRGQTVVIVSRIQLPYENMFEFFIAIDAAKRSSASEVIGIIPYLPHSRQERRDGERTSVPSRLLADIIQLAGADRIMTIEMHSNAIEGFFKIPVDHLHTTMLFSTILRELALENPLLCSPDFGGIKRVRQFKKHFPAEIAVIHKERLKANQVSSMEIIGHVEGKDVILIDDIADTAGTLCKAAELVMERGASSVRAFCTHAILSGNAIENINHSALQQIFVTDTILRTDLPEKIKVISCAPLISKGLLNLINNQSVSQINQEEL